MAKTNHTKTDVTVDVVVIGGGVAGLWTHARLQQAGYRSLLLESDALGAGQTRYAQGIIHGGTKYALTGKLTASSEAVADMPARWRACHAGTGELDLSSAEQLSDAHYLWSTTSLTSRISGFFASRVMRSRSTELDRKSLPGIFQHADFKGQFYRLDEPVFNTLSIIRALAQPREESIMNIDAESLAVDGDRGLRVRHIDGGSYTVHYQRVVFMAGQGNEALLQRFGLEQPVMQLRPLKMVVMRARGDAELNDMIYAHCLGASVNPRITITSHRDNTGKVVWYMGGQIAEDGVDKNDEELIAAARQELAALIPWLDTQQMMFGVLAVDRAEINLTGKKGDVKTRPDSFSLTQTGDLLTAWPTKMALSPALADAILSALEDDAIEPVDDRGFPQWQKPRYADFPWNDAAIWYDAPDQLEAGHRT